MGQGIHATEIELEPAQQRRIAARINALIVEHGGSNAAANLLGVGVNVIAKLRRGRSTDRFLRPKSLDAIAAALKITRHELIHGNAVIVT